MNLVILTGRLGRDPESRTTQSGTTVCTLSVATDEREKDRDGNWVKRPEWHRVVCFGKVAENVARYLEKGRQLSVQGRLRTNKWQDRDGVDRWTTEILAHHIEFLGGGNNSGNGGNDRRDDRGRGRDDHHSDYDDGGAAYDGPDDDIPF